MENKIMVQLSFTDSSHPRVAEIYRLLDTIGLDVMILPTVDRGQMAILLIPKNELKKARAAFGRLSIQVNEKEVLVLHVENKIGTVADISRKISGKGISISYAFLARLSFYEAFLILGCSDNRLALRALDGRPDDFRSPMKPSPSGDGPGCLEAHELVRNLSQKAFGDKKRLQEVPASEKDPGPAYARERFDNSTYAGSSKRIIPGGLRD